MTSNSEINESNLSEELNALVNGLPTFIDPEDVFNFDERSTRVSDNNAKHSEYGISYMKRIRATNLSDSNQRYIGKKVTRNEYFSDKRDEESVSSDDDCDEHNISGDRSDRYENSDEKSSDETNNETEEELEFYSENISAPIATIDDDIDESNDSFNDSETDSIGVNDQQLKQNDNNSDENSDVIVNQFSNIDVSNDEILKGVAVKNQLIIWDKLLECRIKMQKLLIESNKLPQFNLINSLAKCGSNELSDALNDTCDQIKKLLETFYSIDTVIQTQNNALFNRNLLNSDENTSDLKAENILKRKISVFECNEILAKRQKKLNSIRNEIIDMWFNKTQFLSTNTKRKTFDSLELSATKQIEHILSLTDRLVKRTQIKRSVYSIIGKSSDNNDTVAVDDFKSNTVYNNEVDPEIFDDDDFYHQLLREIIENKTSYSDSQTSHRKWLELQRMRNKMKRKVDTKASKGRVVRYDVHSKLVNFMAPIDRLSFTEQAKDQLFNSLFGKTV